MDLQPLTVQRKRASTLDPALTIPAPESSPAHYTRERIQRGVDHATAKLSRNPSPNTEKLLILYKTACFAALHDPVQSHDTRLANLDEIREYELNMSNKSWIAEVRTPRQIELESNLLQLRRFTFWARYGDYTMVLTRMLRSEAAKSEVQFWKEISGKFNWSQISTNIQREEAEWNARGSHSPHLVPTTYAVYQACQFLRIGIDNMINIIHLYAQRNTAFHLGLTEMIEQKKWNLIARCIEDDLRDLSSLVPVNSLHQEEAMNAALHVLKEEWFDTTDDPDVPESWTAKPALKTFGENVKKDKIKAEKEYQQLVAKRAKELLVAGDEEASLLAQASISSNEKIVPPKGAVDSMVKGKVKRKASTEVDVKDRKKAFRTIIEQQEAAHRERKKTLSHVRELNRTVSAYREEYGSSPPTSSPPGPSSEQQPPLP